jgi:hypothetical protein
MPGFTTHYLFGVDAYHHISSPQIRQNLKYNHSAYALGLQGPDLFFYYLPSYLMHRENIGALAHRKDTGAFFANLLGSRVLFSGKEHELAIADAYITGFLGHYTLDCAIHPYVYAFTGYTPHTPPSNTEYFGQHAYFETEIDNELLLRKKQLLPSQFQQNATIHLTPLQHKVIVEMLVHAYRNTYPDILSSEVLLGGAPLWMKMGTRMLNDPSGQKKVLTRFIEKILLGRAFISPMLASDYYCFIQDPLNLTHRKWIHPWTHESRTSSFPELYRPALKHYLERIRRYDLMIQCGCPADAVDGFLTEYGNLSFLSGLPCDAVPLY